MKTSELINIKVKNIKYDAEDVSALPTKMTVKAHPDMLDLLYDTDDGFDNLDESEYIGELIEEKTGEPVLWFEYEI